MLGNSIVASYFGNASFDISGVTLQSLIRLPILGRNTCDLKGKASAQLQEKLKNIKYVIIDEFSVIGLRMLGWIDKRLRQASGLMNTVFGGYSIIMAGDIAQLPPVLDRPLYCSPTEDLIMIMGYYAYKKMNHVVKLEENIRSEKQGNNQFKELLLHLRNGEYIISH